MPDAPRSHGDRDDPVDLIVIGGGINGAGIARDAARRGLSVALFEKKDFGTGATGASSGMIHGGVRYLQKNPEVTRLACLDSGYIQKIASHLIFRIPFVMPMLGRSKRTRIMLELAEVYFEAYDRYQPLKRGKKHCRLSAEETRALLPGIRANTIGAVTTDEWGIDAFRLNFINALDAAECGADLSTYSEVIALLRDGATVRGVRVRDRLSGWTREVFGKVVLNATGAWATHTLGLTGSQRHLVRPGKGIHVVYPGRLTNYAIIASAIDGRQIFICPHQNETWIGTTDDDYWGDLDDVPVLEDEIKYLVDGVASVFPVVRRHRISRTFVGCRPTLYAYGKTESALSREHELFDHAEDGARNLLTIAGGKLASYRIISEEVTDAICRRLGVDATSQTHAVPLPGGAEHDLRATPFVELGIPPYAARRILFRHGSRAGQILEMMREHPRTRAIVCPCEPVTEAELRVVMRSELVRTLDDCRRRCRLGMGVCGGADCVFRAAQIFCQEKGLSQNDVFDVARTFAANCWRERSSTLLAAQLAQEETAQAWMFLSGALAAANTRPTAFGEGSPP